jgi:predicted nucleotidyltransferase component of viral defense system
MIDESALIDLASERFNDIRQLEREYLLNLLLYTISSKRLSQKLVFKGGTALRFFYNLNRFSEDLDFSVIQTKEGYDNKIHEMLDDSIEDVSKQYSIEKVESRGRRDENSKRVLGFSYLIRIKGPLYERNAKRLQNIDIDVSMRNDVLLEPQLKYFSPIYYDIPTFSIYVMDVSEILAEKICAIMERTRMRDVYDSYYLMAYKKINYDESLVKEKMKKRGRVFKKNELIKKLKAANDKMKWNSELSYVVKGLPKPVDVFEFLKDKIILQSKD